MYQRSPYQFRTRTGRIIEIEVATDGHAFVFGRAYASLALAKASIARQFGPETSLRSLQVAAKIVRVA